MRFGLYCAGHIHNLHVVHVALPSGAPAYPPAARSATRAADGRNRRRLVLRPLARLGQQAPPDRRARWRHSRSARSSLHRAILIFLLIVRCILVH